VIDNESGRKDKIMFRCIALVALLILPALGWADRLPSHYPQEVRFQGTIAAVDFSALTIDISELRFYISPTTRFVTPGRLEASRAELSVGRKVGCNYEIDENRRRVLTEVWFLPPGASFED
jgi:hypothetical protein